MLMGRGGLGGQLLEKVLWGVPVSQWSRMEWALVFRLLENCSEISVRPYRLLSQSLWKLYLSGLPLPFFRRIAVPIRLAESVILLRDCNFALTKFEEVYSRLVSPDIKVVIQEPTLFKSKLGHIMSAIVPHDRISTWFKHLKKRISVSASKVL